jgi:hypothetical protein
MSAISDLDRFFEKFRNSEGDVAFFAYDWIGRRLIRAALLDPDQDRTGTRLGPE